MLKDILINEEITKLIQDKGYNLVQNKNVFYGEFGKLIEQSYKSLEANPEVLNSDPYGAGWLADIEVSAAPEGLLSADGYRQITA